MPDTTVEVLENGPYYIQGEFQLLDSQGNPIPAKKKGVALCRCGNSGEKPFCDGSHKRVGFKDPGIPANPES